MQLLMTTKNKAPGLAGRGAQVKAFNCPHIPAGFGFVVKRVALAVAPYSVSLLWLAVTLGVVL